MIAFFRHLIFEYLPYKEKKEGTQLTSLMSINKTEEEEENTCSSSNSVIDKLLGRLPIWPSPPTSSINDTGLQLLNLLQQQTKTESSLTTNQTSINIVDRLNEAIRQAQCTPNPDHRIAVQA